MIWQWQGWSAKEGVEKLAVGNPLKYFPQPAPVSLTHTNGRSHLTRLYFIVPNFFLDIVNGYFLEIGSQSQTFFNGV